MTAGATTQGRAAGRQPAPVVLEGATKRYGDVVALDALDLVVEPGELLVLVGPSGSGKSTALRAVAGLEPLTSGRILIGDRDVTALRPHQRDVAMVFQSFALYPHLTVEENLGFGPVVRRLDAGERDRRIADVAGALGIDGVLGRYPDELSGGQQQRVALARAMVREPAVYLLDEPLSNLDAQLRLAARTEIVQLHRRLGTTTIHVTHDQAEAMTMADRVAVLRDGRLEQVGAPVEVYDHPATSFVATFLGSPPMNLVGGGGALGGHAGTLVGVRPEDLLPLADGAPPAAAPGDVRVDAVVDVVEHAGSEDLVAVRAGDGERLWVRTPPRSPLRPGDAVRLHAPAAHVHVFDAASGRRVQDAA